MANYVGKRYLLVVIREFPCLLPGLENKPWDWALRNSVQIKETLALPSSINIVCVEVISMLETWPQFLLQEVQQEGERKRGRRGWRKGERDALGVFGLGPPVSLRFQMEIQMWHFTLLAAMQPPDNCLTLWLPRPSHTSFSWDPHRHIWNGDRS